MTAQTETAVTIEYVTELMNRLSPRERLQVMQRVLPQVEEAIPTNPSEEPPLRSYRGVLKGMMTVTDEDIAEMRREVWKNFGEGF